MGAHRWKYILNPSILFSSLPGSSDPSPATLDLCFHHLMFKISHYCLFPACACGRSCLPEGASAVTDARGRPGYVCKSLNSTCDLIDWIFQRLPTPPGYSYSTLTCDSEKRGVEVQEVFNPGRRRSLPGRAGLTYREGAKYSTGIPSQCPYTSAGSRPGAFLSGRVYGAPGVDEPDPPAAFRIRLQRHADPRGGAHGARFDKIHSVL